MLIKWVRKFILEMTLNVIFKIRKSISKQGKENLRMYLVR